MIYSNFEFIILFILTTSLYWSISDYRARYAILLVASIIFYAWTGLLDTVIFASVILVSWFATLLAHHFPAKKKFFLVSGIVIMAAHLFFWKYAPWLSGEIQKVLPAFLGGRKLALPLPIGISFFTLQGIAYLVDYMDGEVGFISLGKYTLFKSFFPQLVAGPIVRVPQLLPQLEQLKSPTWTEKSEGASLFTMGLFKKMLLADRCSPLVDRVFLQPNTFDRMGLIYGILGYAVQIWADFSGYTDMGRGAALMLGIRLPENFLSPYLSRSPVEFWRRWHITLSLWIRDYIYIPLGGSKGSKLRVFIVALTTMVISGLWHGANWTFLLWGIYHGLLLALHRFWKTYEPAKVRAWFKSNRAGSFLCGACTLMMVLFGWLIFRSASVQDLGLFIWSFIHNSGKNIASESLPVGELGLYFFVCLVIQTVSYYRFETSNRPVVQAIQVRFHKTMASSPPRVRGWAPVAGGFLLALIFASTIIFRQGTASKAFIYFQF